jgi:hypothetical protein
MCEDISKALDRATGNVDLGLKFYTTISSSQAQRVLKEEIAKIKTIKSANKRVVKLLAVLEVFGGDLFWIRDTEDCGLHFQKLLDPMIALYRSLLKMSNKKLCIDEEGRRYVEKVSDVSVVYAMRQSFNKLVITICRLSAIFWN